MTKPTRVRDPLGPLDAVTSFLVTVLVLVFVSGAVLAVFTDITFFDVNGDDICVEADGSVGSSPRLETEDREFFGLREGVTTYVSRTRVCDPSPALVDRALTGLSVIPTFAVFVGFLALTRRTIRHARRHGLFSESLPGRITRLGWLLLVGLLAAAVIECVARILLFDRLVSDGSSASSPFSVSVAGIIGAAGLISMGRVLARAASLQDEADVSG